MPPEVPPETQGPRPQIAAVLASNETFEVCGQHCNFELGDISTAENGVMAAKILLSVDKSGKFSLGNLCFDPARKTFFFQINSRYIKFRDKKFEADSIEDLLTEVKEAGFFQQFSTSQSAEDAIEAAKRSFQKFAALITTFEDWMRRFYPHLR